MSHIFQFSKYKYFAYFSNQKENALNCLSSVQYIYTLHPELELYRYQNIKILKNMLTKHTFVVRVRDELWSLFKIQCDPHRNWICIYLVNSTDRVNVLMHKSNALSSRFFFNSFFSPTPHLSPTMYNMIDIYYGVLFRRDSSGRNELEGTFCCPSDPSFHPQDSTFGRRVR